MFSRRFLLLAGILATLNVALWLAPPGLALRHAVINQLFGPKLIRGEAVEKSPVGGSTDWRFDRGVIVSVTSSQITLREADGRIQPIPISGTTTVVHLRRHLSPGVLAPRWRVLVTWPANGAAQSVDVERIPRSPHFR